MKLLPLLAIAFLFPTAAPAQSGNCDGLLINGTHKKVDARTRLLLETAYYKQVISNGSSSRSDKIDVPEYGSYKGSRATTSAFQGTQWNWLRNLNEAALVVSSGDEAIIGGYLQCREQQGRREFAYFVGTDSGLVRLHIGMIASGALNDRNSFRMRAGSFFSTLTPERGTDACIKVGVEVVGANCIVTFRVPATGLPATVVLKNDFRDIEVPFPVRTVVQKVKGKARETFVDTVAKKPKNRVKSNERTIVAPVGWFIEPNSVVYNVTTSPRQTAHFLCSLLQYPDKQDIVVGANTIKFTAHSRNNTSGSTTCYIEVSYETFQMQSVPIWRAGDQ